MLFQLVAVLLSLVTVGQSVLVYSSFWAPLFDPRILNYRVDAPFAPDAARAARASYQRMYGPRGVDLIADMGNGKGPSVYRGDKNYGDVKFYYTGAQTATGKANSI